ncbi:MAG: transposase family protein [Caldilineaceae bacterium]|nr:transposase family protein [Caldilineaceae bacterium]
MSVFLFDELNGELEPKFLIAERERLERPDRQRAVGGGRNAEVEIGDQLLMSIIWLRCYPKQHVLGYLFGISDSSVSRILARVLPLLEASGRDTMRLPDPGRKQRRELDELLLETPALAVIIDTFEQRVQRHKDPKIADTYYSGKKKQHTLKSQVAIDEVSGLFVDVSESMLGPTADMTVLKQSQLLERLPAGVGAIGDLGYIGIDKLHPTGNAASPRRKPCGHDRPPEDIAFNTAFSRRRIDVEHAINRARRFEALSQMDRHHRRSHTARVVAVCGLVNRRLAHTLALRFPALKLC